MSHHELPNEKLAFFPHLSPGGTARPNYRITSDETDDYNCVAWAAGFDNQRWDPSPGYYWPPGALRDSTRVQSFIEAFASLGYVICADGGLEEGYDKVVIYSRRGEPQHAALQLRDGSWSSKLGDWEDIGHDSEGDVGGDCTDCYGGVDTYMRRPRAEQVQ